MYGELHVIDPLDIVEGAAGQDDLPGGGPDGALVSFAHHAVEQIAMPGLNSKLPASLCADVVVVHIVPLIAAQPAQGVPVLALLLDVRHLNWMDLAWVVVRSEWTRVTLMTTLLGLVGVRSVLWWITWHRN